MICSPLRALPGQQALTGFDSSLATCCIVSPASTLGEKLDPDTIILLPMSMNGSRSGCA